MRNREICSIWRTLIVGSVCGIRRQLTKSHERPNNFSPGSLQENSDDLALKAPVSRRKVLPHEQLHGAATTLLAILRGNLPACMFEPLSDIQAATENLRYAKHFLDKMPSNADPMERMILLCAFVVSNYSGMVERRRIPFTALLGETYDYISEDGWRYYGEKVNYDPSITACHSEGPGWELIQNFQAKMSLTLNSVSIASFLPEHLKLTNGDEYSWFRATITIQNARGEAQDRRVLYGGEITIKSNTGIEGKLTFYCNEDNTVTGEIIRTKDSVVLCRLTGSWDKYLNKILPNNKVSTIYEAIPPSEHASSYYGFSDFAVTLNEIHDYENPYLPFTDSRFRPDQRHLENGDATLTTEKAKKKLDQADEKRAKQPHTPLWFHKEFDEFIGISLWHPNKKYWDSKKAQFNDEHSRRMVKLFEKKS